MATISTKETIPKELIKQLKIEGQEVLQDEQSRIQRTKQLMHAMIVGNTYQRKVWIAFDTGEGVKQVHTTVWGMTTREVILKNGIHIPTCRILSVREKL